MEKSESIDMILQRFMHLAIDFGNTQDVAEAKAAIQALLTEAKVEELRELIQVRWPESRNYVENRIAELTKSEGEK